MANPKWQEWSGEELKVFTDLIKELRNSSPERSSEIKKELSDLSGHESDDGLAGWLNWFIEKYLELPEPAVLLTSADSEDSIIHSGPSVSQDNVFEKSEYNWCALERIKNGDDMQKLRSVHNDLECLIDVDSDNRFSFSRMTGLEGDELDFFKNKSLSDVLFGDEADVIHLRILKDFAKIMMISSMPARTQRSGAILYAAAISQAIVRHDIKISNLSYSDLAKSLESLLDRPYVVDSYARLFNEALNKCL
ncbi:MAG: hypothetical protein ACYTFY_10180 [Planctomycetota bacterium]|jgi:hypothetical protein